MRRVRRTGFSAHLALACAFAGAAGCGNTHHRASASTEHRPRSRPADAGAASSPLLSLQPGGLPTPDDFDIERAVERALADARGLHPNLLDVRVDGGVVTLFGFVDNVIAERRALRIARAVAYVRRVMDHTEVRPQQSRNDQAISQYVRDALANDPTARAWKLHVHVEDSVVTLTGDVATQPEKWLAGDLAADIRGVTAVNNRVELDATVHPDAAVREHVRDALRWDARLCGDLFRVDVHAGRVRLRGAVRSALERALAARDAWLPGVVAVDAAGVKVDRGRASYGLAAAPADSAIRAGIEQALRRGARTAPLPPSSIRVAVERGVASLSGSVPSLAARRAAAQIAADTTGVRRVEARLAVDPAPPLKDAAVAQAISLDLVLDPYVNRYDFDVQVHGGRAAVSGRVDSYFDKWQALAVAARARGVTAVVDRVTVDYALPVAGRRFRAWNPVLMDDDYHHLAEPERKPDWEIRENLADRLRWCALVDPTRIGAKVTGGAVTLTGRVATRRGRAAATWAAFLAGARSVRDALRIEPGSRGAAPPPPAARTGR